MEVTFEQLPSAVGLLISKLDSIEKLLLEKSTPVITSEDQLLTIQQASTLAHLSVPTFYGLVHRNEVPCMKKGKRLYFSKQELTDWIKEGRRKTAQEAEREAEAFLRRKKTEETVNLINNEINFNDNTLLQDMGISIRLYNNIKYYFEDLKPHEIKGIHIKNITESDFMKIRTAGKKSLEELCQLRHRIK